MNLTSLAPTTYDMLVVHYCSKDDGIAAAPPRVRVPAQARNAAPKISAVRSCALADKRKLAHSAS